LPVPPPQRFRIASSSNPGSHYSIDAAGVSRGRSSRRVWAATLSPYQQIMTASWTRR
jgi:hypothetical protein